MTEPTSIITLSDLQLPNNDKCYSCSTINLNYALRKIYDDNNLGIDYDVIKWLKNGAVKKNELDDAIEFSKKYKEFYKRQLDLIFWNTKIYLSDYDFTIELQKSKFLVDILLPIYKFSITNNEIQIYKKTKNLNIYEKISHDDFIYEIQIELHEYFEIILKCKTEMNEFYKLFGKINDLKKAIDNIRYLKKFLN